ncbi:MAG: BON domain-containing protein [Burkholderiales bacterium]|nr:BON domain-containing protein [Flavobacterium sp.]
MKTDEKLLLDVSDALKSELLTANCDIGVASENRIITLMGAVDYYTKKTDDEKIAKEVTGVKSVVNKIDVRLNSWEEKKDLQITAEILNVFRWNWNTLNDTIEVNVTNGWVTLTGTLAWNYQKEAAKEAITNLMGVKGVSNNIIIQSQKDIKVEKINLINALQNHLALDSQHIEIVVLDSNITLKGTVDCWFQKELAGRIAWKTPGVINVDNELMIEEK